MSPRIYILYTFFLLSHILCYEPAQAQSEYLVLEKTLSDRAVIYRSGDKITFRLKGEDFYRTNHIIALNDSSIEFHYYSVNYLEIDKIYLKRQRLSGFSLRMIGTYSQIAGLGYIAIDQFNQVLVRGEDPTFNDEVFIVGGLIFVSGTLLKFLEPRKIRVGGKYRLRYMNLNTY